jgi:predicted GNAT family N-acyltransferase
MTGSVTAIRNDREIIVRLARGMDDLVKVFAVRAAVYIGEEACPYEEEFDGNDFCAAHFLALVDGEPVGVLRVRFFGAFGKLERLAVRREFRSLGIGSALAGEAIAYCSRKGFARLLAHARHERLSFWSRFGFRPQPRAESFIFSDYSYLEVWCDLEPRAVGHAALSNPYVVIRPENDWDHPCRLEGSVARPSRSEPLATRSLNVAA